jgi:hypothetical protein
MKEMSKVHLGCLARGETKAVEVALDISMAMSRASWLVGMDEAKGRQGSARLPCKKHKTH